MTQDNNAANLRLFFLKLGEFLVAKKYIDVTIQCGDEYFKCHRVTLAMASTFFDYLFDGFPKENASVSNSANSETTDTRETFFLDYEISAVKEFKLILQFIYSGMVETNFVTYCRILETREYFGITGMTLDTDSAKLRQLYSKLEEFRVAEKYSDVTIECRTKYFKCHRVILAAASEFFDKLFGSRKVDVRETFVLGDEVRLEVFEPILKFIYCGEITIDSSNIYGLLRACEYFCLTGTFAILRLCEKFASENRMCVETTIDAFLFAYQRKLHSLTSILRCNIAEQFASFSKSKKFLELSLDEQSLIQSMSVAVYRNALFGASASEWNSHRPKADVAKSAITRVRPNRPREIDYSQVPKMSTQTGFRKDLKVYLRNMKTDTVNVFSIDDKSNFNFRSQVWNQKDLRAVALANNHLYCVHYPRRNSQNVRRSFCRYSSADLRCSIQLKDPPVVPCKDLHLCATKTNNIYGYTKLPNHLCRDYSTSYGEVSDGIHYYNCFLDNWFPVPPLKEEIFIRCATTVGNMLYLFGKSHTTSDTNTSSSVICVQTYDRRIKKWLKHPAHSVVNCGQAMTCCANNDTNRIYVHTQTQEVVSYDITAQKWDPVPARMQRSNLYAQLISYSGKIWAMGNSFLERRCFFEVEVYDNDNWRTINLFTNTANDFPNDVREALFLDAVVFK